MSLLLSIVIALCWLPVSKTGQGNIGSATASMQIEDNRVFVPLCVTGPNGVSKVVPFWVDSGGDAVFLSGRLARELGLKGQGSRFEAMGETPAHFVTKPRLSLAGMPIDLEHASVAAPLAENSSDVFIGIAAGGFLPATVLRNYDVVFDYPGHTFTLAEPGVITHRGAILRVAVQPTTGFVTTEIELAGQTYGFMLDTGAAYTGISRAVLDRWIREHPLWPHSVGAVGAANMVGKHFDVTNMLVRVPRLKWGPFLLRDVGMVSRPTGNYEKALSKDMAAPVVGALSGNVLREFRIEVDYPRGVAYLAKERSNGSDDLDCVGVVLRVESNGTVLVSGIVGDDGRPEVKDVRAGDILLRVDGHDVTGTSLATILRYLSGPVGENKRLTVRRGKQKLTVTATVLRHPSSGP